MAEPWIDIAEAKDWLSGNGFDIPDLVLSAWLEIIEEKRLCLGDGSKAKLAVFYLLSLYGLSSGNRYISSQSAPSGAGRSFKYSDLSSAWKGNLQMLKMFDVNKCLADSIPPSPADNKTGALFIGRGC